MSDIVVEDAPPPPSTPEELEAAERHWLANVYRGDSLPELTLQVFVISLGLGALMIAFNIYMGLKTGWGEGGSIIAVILGFALMRVLGRKYSELENNATQTFASAAGSLGNIVNVIPALILLAEDGLIERGPSFLDILLWVFFTSFLGVFFAIPLRRQMLVVDQLVFPTGTAAAQTIKAMHATGTEAMAKAKALGLMGLGSAVVTFFRDSAVAFLPHDIAVPAALNVKGIALKNLTIGAAVSPMMIGAGFLVGPRVGVSLALGGFAAFGIIAPILIDSGIAMDMARMMTTEASLDQCNALLAAGTSNDWFGENCKYMARMNAGAYYSIIVKWTMWPGLGIMVAAGLTSTALKWRIIVRALKGLFRKSTGPSPIAHLEVPPAFWMIGLALSTIAVCGMLQIRFGVPAYFGLLAVLLSFILSVIAVRATGETDINPVGAMGSVTQIAFGALQTGSTAATGAVISGNLLTGGVAAGGASEAADMMQDLKTGWLLGATPRRQVYAQLMGVFFGSFFCAAIFWVLIQTHPIGSEYWPAPAAITWSGLATMMAKGTSALPAYAMPALGVGILIGILIPVIEAKAPAAVKNWMPSATGMGVAMVVPYVYCFSIFLGSMIYLGIKKKNPAWILAFAGAIGAGGIAGEGIMGVGLAIWGALPDIWAAITGG